MSVSQWESLIEMPRERFGVLNRLLPDSPWSTTTLHAIQTRRATVFADSLDEPKNLAVCVRGGDVPGDYDKAYVFGHPSREGLRAFVAGVKRATEFVVDEELTPMVLEIHPEAATREAICCWFEDAEVPDHGDDEIVVRRLRSSDVDAVRELVPPSSFRTFESPNQMILTGACYGVEDGDQLASVAYVVDQSIKYARISVVTAEPYQRRGFGISAARKLMEHVSSEGRHVCALVPRRNAAAVHFSMKLGFPKKALLRTYEAQPRADEPPAPDDASSAESTSSSEQTQD